MPQSTIIHGTCVAWDGRGLLIVGSSGSGKSTLALSLMAWGCALVADDRVVLDQNGTEVIASVAPELSGLIEARGLGLLKADTCGPTPLNAVVDLDQTETARFPEKRFRRLHNCSFPLFFKVDEPHFEAAIMQFLKFGRSAP